MSNGLEMTTESSAEAGWVCFMDAGAQRVGWLEAGSVRPVALELAAALALATPPDDARAARAARPLETLTLALPLVPGARVFCIQRNYQAHAQELGGEAPAQPAIFLRARQSLVAANATLLRPRISECHDYEGELAVVIGRPARHVTREQALHYVGAYSCFNDGSIRDWQRQSITTGKNFEASGALGPALVPASRVSHPNALEVRTHLNGREVQSGSTRQMIHDVAALVAYLSDMTCLQPGDVIATGTPEGVGWARQPPLWLQPGDVVSVEVEQVGRLVNRVTQEP
ncbi:MAG: fumarylacetoacetate hydrolase family protein [Gammaproteobacteria bacterium]|nr:fumarylacetoacetate hydrolase family protein [Gammaproteobacteria bacterium]